MKKVCISCKKDITNDSGSVDFKCPSCNDSAVIRCKHCREISAKYKCAKCGFEGPN